MEDLAGQRLMEIEGELMAVLGDGMAVMRGWMRSSGGLMED